MPAEKVANTKSENRRSNKPLMEKRRRARINQSLSELKNLILDAMKKDSSRSTKLEKADILELAVKHLQNLQKQQSTEGVVAESTQPTSSDTASVLVKYRAGFNECAQEVSRFLDSSDEVDVVVRGRLVSHLLTCLNELCTSSALSPDTTTSAATSCDPSPSSSPSPSPLPRSDSAASPESTTDAAAPATIRTTATPPGEETASSTTSGSSTSSGTNDIPTNNPTGPLNLTSRTSEWERSSLPATTRVSGSPQLSSGSAQPNSGSPRLSSASQLSEATTTVGLQLIPTRLASGELAFVLPNSADPRFALSNGTQRHLSAQVTIMRRSFKREEVKEDSKVETNPMDATNGNDDNVFQPSNDSVAQMHTHQVELVRKSLSPQPTDTSSASGIGRSSSPWSNSATYSNNKHQQPTIPSDPRLHRSEFRVERVSSSCSWPSPSTPPGDRESVNARSVLAHYPGSASKKRFLSPPRPARQLVQTEENVWRPW